MAEEKKRKLENESEKIHPHVFIFSAEEPDDLHVAILIDPEGQNLADILDRVFKDAMKEAHGDNNSNLLVNFWSLAEEKDKTKFTEKEIETMIKTFGDKFWEKEWKFYHANELPCEEFPFVHPSMEWY